MDIRPATEEKTVLFLQYNLIAELDLSHLKQYQIDGLHKILERFDIYLDGNPINCSCASHRMYEYLLSASSSERPNLDEKETPDFSFCENNVGCVEPLEWRGAILSEYEYDKCVYQVSLSVQKHASVTTAGLLTVPLETVPVLISMR